MHHGSILTVDESGAFEIVSSLATYGVKRKNQSNSEWIGTYVGWTLVKPGRETANFDSHMGSPRLQPARFRPFNGQMSRQSSKFEGQQRHDYSPNIVKLRWSLSAAAASTTAQSYGGIRCNSVIVQYDYHELTVSGPVSLLSSILPFLRLASSRSRPLQSLRDSSRESHS